MKILFAGTPANAAATLKFLIDSPFDVVAVLTRSDAPVGRKRILTPSPVAQVAHECGIPVIKANRVTEEVIEQIKKFAPDAAIVVAYGALLDSSALRAIPKGWFNIHFSLLPKWRGAAPVQHALLAGDSTTGVTLFKIDEGLDTGPIAGQIPTEINPDETAGDLLARLTELGNTLLAEQLPLLASDLIRLDPQKPGTSAAAAKIGRSMAHISWPSEAGQIENLVRAFNPEPMAFSHANGNAIRILRARAIDGSLTSQLKVAKLSPGDLAADKSRVFVCCGNSTWLELLEVQPAGKSVMTGMDWYRGVQTKVSRLHGFEETNG